MLGEGKGKGTCVNAKGKKGRATPETLRSALLIAVREGSPWKRVIFLPENSREGLSPKWTLLVKLAKEMLAVQNRERGRDGMVKFSSGGRDWSIKARQLCKKKGEKEPTL